ncbi:ATP-binding protein [Chryseobacterium sp. CFS15]|uniref:ATP-binding protein n=1 Tax=Chryseobacterium sp. CFS15 TaxID=2986946 RepID=UPI002806CEBC|nr:ATP-binding protein [Chryseobacterium sp. CFS15]MDQ8144421.1 ATP-binding protein [Chryseobacterium sp. CFS15]
MRNAYSGYTYQKHITQILLSIMDVERNISKIEIEAKVDDNFDDLLVHINNEQYSFQIKDFEDVTLEQLIIDGENLIIRGKAHKLSKNKNIVFFKNIDIVPNAKVLDFDCFKKDNLHIISMSRADVDFFIDDLYNGNLNRKFEIENYLSKTLDNRIWIIDKSDLPSLKTYSTDLQQESIKINHTLVEFDKLLLIEGKPGVGKSHFVNSLVEIYPLNILYRFWVGNQESDYQERLKFQNFLQDLNVKLFHDLKNREIYDLFKEIQRRKLTLIIDGLDHIENYNNNELNRFVNFIEQLKEHCKIVVLSRPLVAKLDWQKQILENWNKKQTEFVLEELFHITDFTTQKEIFYLTQGYPILVKYVTEFYKLNKKLPETGQLQDIDCFYESIIKNEKGKYSLSIFLCTNSYIMYSELDLFLGEAKYYVEEFIGEHPYLFETKLNRVSLFHDSFNTYLRNKSTNYKALNDKATDLVYDSIISLNKKFLSRFSLFKLTNQQRKEIAKKFSNITIFEQIIKDSIDIEAIRTFYFDLRDCMSDYKFDDFEISHYYDLSLIINLIYRDHTSTPDGFLYTYTQSLLFNGYTEEHITSSGYLFSMLFYVKTNDPILLYNKVSNDNYSTDHFHLRLEGDVDKEEYFFIRNAKVITKTKMLKFLKYRLYFGDYLKWFMENLFLHQKRYKGLEELSDSLDLFLEGFESKGSIKLAKFLDKYPNSYYSADRYLNDVKKNLIAAGCEVSNIEKNEYNHLTLEELILKNKEEGSFKLGNKIHEYMRLALHQKKKIDLASISLFWTKYYNRKDYTLYSLPKALKALHKNNFLTLNECIIIITKIQDVSEKGYRYLLGEFIELYQPSEIMPCIEKLNLNNLSLQWFLLPTKYINSFSHKVYSFAINQLLKANRTESIEIEEIRNGLLSTRLKDIEPKFSITKTKIRVDKSDNIIKELKNSKILFQVYVDREKDRFKETSEERLNKGYIYPSDFDLIKENKLSPIDISKLADSDSSSLVFTELFEIYEKNEVTNNFSQILYNAIIGKTWRGEYNYMLAYTSGHILYMIEKYRSKNEFEEAVKSFKKFIQLSLIEINWSK